MAPASFFALLVIAVSFLPVLTLEAQEGRLFKPLAYTKTLAMIVAAFLAITLDPALRLLFTRLRRFDFRPAWLRRVANAVLVGHVHPEDAHPISRVLIRLYEPVVRWSLRWKWLVIGGLVALILATVPVFFRLGSEFMPPLDEGSLFYMPTTMPGISITEAQKLLQVTDRIIRQFPEVDRVLGKAGRADTQHRPGAALDARDRDHPQAAVRVAARADLVLVLGPGVAEAGLPPHHLRPHLDGGARQPAQRGAPAARALERLDDADQGAHRHADDRHPHAARAEDLGRRPREDRGRRRADRGAPAVRAGHPERLRGAHRRRLLPRRRLEPRRAGPLRAEHGGGAGRRAERDRRRERHDHGRGTGALPGERPLHARLPLRPRRARPRAGAGLRRASGRSRSASSPRSRSRPARP